MLNQELLQKQHLRILPQQIEFLNLLQLTSQQMVMKIHNEIIENPMLEIKDPENPADPVDKPSKDAAQDYQDPEEYEYEDLPDYKMEYQNYFDDAESPHCPLSACKDFREDAIEQLQYADAPKEIIELAALIVDSLNDNGILEQSIDTLADDLSFKLRKVVSEADLELALKQVQSLDPVGIGARDTRECLLLQLQRKEKKSPLDKAAIALLQQQYKLLISAQFDKIKESMQWDDEEFKIVINHIATLKPRPVTVSVDAINPKTTILPDFVVSLIDDKLVVSLKGQYADDIYINADWAEKIKNHPVKDKGTAQYLRNKLSAAEWFIQAVKQREDTMLRTMRIIVEFQKDYFMEGGDTDLLKPMVLKDIALKAGVDISTVSRVASNKYVDTPFGIILIKQLFSEGIVNAEGVKLSNQTIKKAIAELVTIENKTSPLTDQEIVGELVQKGMLIARRTVAKYRELLQIPMSQFRKLTA